MKIVIAPNAFKGSLTAFEAAQAISQGVRRVFAEATIVEVPLADGGDGTAAVLVQATRGKFIAVDNVLDPLGQPRQSQFGVLGDGSTAVVEMADASGLRLIPGRLNPLVATTYGTGQLIRACLDHGFRKIIVGVGGSASVDGGAGMAPALGAKLLDAAGRDVEPGGGSLGNLDLIDLSSLDPRIAATQIEVACDVENPLVGTTGAAAVFGPQKGATPDMVKSLDANLTHYAAIVERDMGKSVAALARGGAAGGLGAGLAAFLNARLSAGIDLVIDITGIEDHLHGAALLITGEGMIDSQTIYGKVPVGIALRAHTFGVPVVAIVGCVGPGADVVYDHGIDGLMSIVACPMALDIAMRDAFTLTADATERMLRLVKIGRALGKEG